MKSLFILFFVAVMYLTSSTANGQLLGSFKASAGIKTAKKSADSVMTSAQLVGILTLGDTTSAIQLPIPVKFLDYSNGTSQGWLYFYRGKAIGKTTDTTISIGVVAIAGILFQPINLDLGIGAVGGFFAKDSVIPAKFTDSDIMMKNINANAEHKAFMTANPNSKPFLIPLGFYPTARFFPRNTLLWQLTFPPTTGKGTMVCEVNGTTGETKCQTITAVDEDIQTSSLYITPNPASHQATIFIPNELYTPTISIELFNSTGRSIQQFSISTNISERIIIPLDGLDDGVYFVKYSNGKNIITKPIVIQN